MAERHDLPRIIPDKQPSIFNREMADGAIWGSILAFPAVFFKSMHDNLSAFSIVGAAIGGIIGGFHGKKREQREQIEGKVVADPTLINGGMLGGMAVGYLGSDVLDVMPGKQTKLGWGASILAWVGLGVVGGLIGREHMKKELKQAQDAKAEALQQVLATPLPAPAFKNTVTLDDLVRLEAQKKATPKNHTIAVTTARDEAAQQEIGV